MRPLKIGDMRIDRLVEIDALAFEKKWLFANVTDEVIAENRGWLDRTFGTRAPDALVFERRLPYLSDQWRGMRRGEC